MILLEVFLQFSLSVVSIVVYHYLHEVYQGGFLLIAALGSLRIFIDPLASSYPVLLMIASIAGKLMNNEFVSIIIVVLLVTSLVSVGFHPIESEETINIKDTNNSQPTPPEASPTRLRKLSSPDEKGVAFFESPTKSSLRSTRSRSNKNEGVQKLKEAKELARQQEETRKQKRVEELKGKK